MPGHSSPLTSLAQGAAAATPGLPWRPLALTGLPRFDADAVRAQWPRLHAGQCLSVPDALPLLDGWVHFHNGEFESAYAIGVAQGPAGQALANRAAAVYANYVEPSEATRLQLFRQIVERTGAQIEAEPANCHARYWYAYALGRYSQGTSVARAHAQGFGRKLKGALERLIELQPGHADAHLALGAFHAEVIDKVGQLVGRMTYGVHADKAEELFARGLSLNPHSASGLIEYANALVMIHGRKRQAEATQLYERAAALPAADAREWLDREAARAGLAEA